MFGFGREARERREAVKLICAALDAEAKKKADIRAHLGLAPEASSTTPLLALAEQLMARAGKWPARSFVGQVLPNPTAVGRAIEALSYGLDDLAGRNADQQIVMAALGGVLAYAAKHPDRINDADYEMFQIMGERYVNHPLVKAASQKAA